MSGFEENKVNVSDRTTNYTKEADYLRAVDELVDKLEFAMNNDMELKPYKLKEMINNVKIKKAIMMSRE